MRPLPVATASIAPYSFSRAYSIVPVVLRRPYAPLPWGLIPREPSFHLGEAEHHHGVARGAE
jgi:hypothetical protein